MSIKDFKVGDYVPNTQATIAKDGTYPGTDPQPSFDNIAWQSFVALNWPWDSATSAPSTSLIGAKPDAQRVWFATFKTGEEVFGLGSSIPSGVTCDGGDGLPTLNRTSKLSFVNSDREAMSGALIDAKGNFAVFDARMNPTAADYLTGKNTGLDLTTTAGQLKYLKDNGKLEGSTFKASLNYPGIGTNGAPGAIEIKTAWRVLSDSSEASKYYTTKANIIAKVRPSGSGDGTDHCFANVTIGLVGMHIAQKITAPAKFANLWSWATFEHVDNAPQGTASKVSQVNAAERKDAGEKDYAPLTSAACTVGTSSASYAFYTACTGPAADCKSNIEPTATKTSSGSSYFWAMQPPYAADYMTTLANGQKVGSQVVRCYKPYSSANTVTGMYQAKLKAAGSVFANYRLIGTQWAQQQASVMPYPPFKLQPYTAPMYLTNAVQETYFQISGIYPPPSNLADFHPGSCITCHATFANHTFKAAGPNGKDGLLDFNLSFFPGFAAVKK